MGIRVREIESWSAKEIEEYMAQYSIEPWGEDRADIRTGYAAATMYNLKRPRRARAMQTKEFMPRWHAPRTQSAEEIKLKLTMFAQAHNAKVKK